MSGGGNDGGNEGRLGGRPPTATAGAVVAVVGAGVASSCVHASCVVWLLSLLRRIAAGAHALLLMLLALLPCPTARLLYRKLGAKLVVGMPFKDIATSGANCTAEGRA